jgi:hypothetical protein
MYESASVIRQLTSPVIRRGREGEVFTVTQDGDTYEITVRKLHGTSPISAAYLAYTLQSVIFILSLGSRIQLNQTARTAMIRALEARDTLRERAVKTLALYAPSEDDQK